MSSKMESRSTTGTMFANRDISVQAIHLAFGVGADGEQFTIRDGDSGSDPIIVQGYAAEDISETIHLPFGLRVKNGFHVTLGTEIEVSMIEGGMGGSYLRGSSGGVISAVPLKIQGMFVPCDNVGVGVADLSDSGTTILSFESRVDRFQYHTFYQPLNVKQLSESLTNIDPITVFLA